MYAAFTSQIRAIDDVLNPNVSVELSVEFTSKSRVSLFISLQPASEVDCSNKGDMDTLVSFILVPWLS